MANPFPVTIVNSPSAFGTAPPIQVGALNRYVCIADSSVSPSLLRMYKSVDGGQTWVEVNAAGAPQSFNAGPATGYACILVGTKIWTFSNNAANTQLAAFPFNTLNDSWGIPTVAAGAISNLFSASAEVFLIPATAQVIVAYQPQSLAVTIVPFGTFSRVAFTVFDTNALTFAALVAIGETNAAVAKSWTVNAIVLGNNLAHFIMVNDNGVVNSLFTLNQQTVSLPGLGLNALQSGIATSDPTNGPQFFYAQAAWASGDGTNIVMTWQPNSTVKTLTMFHALSAQNMVFATQALFLSGTIQTLKGISLLPGTTVYLILTYTGASNSGLGYYTSPQDGSNFTGFTQLATGATTFRWNFATILTGIAGDPWALFMQGSGFYWEFALGAGGPGGGSPPPSGSGSPIGLGPVLGGGPFSLSNQGWLRGCSTGPPSTVLRSLRALCERPNCRPAVQQYVERQAEKYRSKWRGIF